MLRKWDELPKNMQTEEVRLYYDILKKKQLSLFFKRLFDIVVSLILLILLSPLMLGLSIAIAIDSEGGVFFRQERVTQYGKTFRIHKFRTMVTNAESIGSQVTIANDMRVSKIGAKIRNCRLDELPQLIDIFVGDMSFVGTRPEVTKYVEKYSSEMMATLLLPAGVTSEASIRYKDEAVLLQNVDDIDAVYVNEVLTQKMVYNLSAIKYFSIGKEIMVMFRTVFAVNNLKLNRSIK